MTPRPKVVLTIGSPKTGQSTSGVLAEGLRERMQAAEAATAIFHARETVESHQTLRVFLDALRDADLWILSFPIYVDTLPAASIRLLEEVFTHRGELPSREKTRLAAVANSGMPEAWQCHTALAQCRKFASQCGFAWGGALALGGGGALNGRPLDSFGAMLRDVGEALDLAAAALLAGGPIPPEATDLMARPYMPSSAYLSEGGLGWKRRGRRLGFWKAVE